LSPRMLFTAVLLIGALIALYWAAETYFLPVFLN
jgi:hypothetical protein